MATPISTPPLSLLQAAKAIIRPAESDAALEENARMLESVLDDYGVRGEIGVVRPGPVVTMYELEPAPGLESISRDRPVRRHRPFDVSAVRPCLNRFRAAR